MKPVSLSLAELSTRVSQLAGGKLEATIVGSPDVQLTGVATLSTATRSDLSFLANPLYRADALKTGAGALVLSASDHAALPSEATTPTMVVCQQPYVWFAYAAQALNPAGVLQPGVQPGAHVAGSAQIHPTARVDPGATIAEDAIIGAGVSIGSGATIGARAVVGSNTRIYSRVSVLDDCKIGQRCILHSGAVIGSDGFGFAPFEGRWVKIPQLGTVIIGDDVEVGANTTIDRGSMGNTVIEEGVKLDNQIQIAHNCVIGAHTVIAACVGIAGSAKIGRGCRIGGAAMIAGHLSIADGSDIGPATAVMSSLERGHYTAFFPLMPQREWERVSAVVRRLPDLRARLRRLEAQQSPSTHPAPGEAK